MDINVIIEYGRNFLKGNLTYTVAWLSIVWSVFGVLVFPDYITTDLAVQIINTSLLAIGIRRSIKTK